MSKYINKEFKKHKKFTIYIRSNPCHDILDQKKFVIELTPINFVVSALKTIHDSSEIHSIKFAPHAKYFSHNSFHL